MSSSPTIQSQNQIPSYWAPDFSNRLVFCQASGQLQCPDGHSVEVVPLFEPPLYEGPVTREQILEERLNDKETELAYTKALVKRIFMEKCMAERQLAATQRELNITRSRLEDSYHSHHTGIQLNTHKREFKKKEDEIVKLQSQDSSSHGSERRGWRKKIVPQEQSMEKTTETFAYSKKTSSAMARKK
jgi:hypothetical protein